MCQWTCWAMHTLSMQIWLQVTCNCKVSISVIYWQELSQIAVHCTNTSSFVWTCSALCSALNLSGTKRCVFVNRVIFVHFVWRNLALIVQTKLWSANETNQPFLFVFFSFQRGSDGAVCIHAESSWTRQTDR